MNFASIPGHKELKTTLINAVRNNHVAHAQLFVGQSGGAATALALAFAKYLNCENQQESDACGSCSSCHKFNKLIHPDLHFLFPFAKTSTDDKKFSRSTVVNEFRNFLIEQPFSDDKDWGVYQEAAEKQLNISVEEARTMIADISLKAFEGKYKIVLLWLPELLNNQASNAILKVLEEPTPQTIFLIVSQNITNVLPTILSRCQIIQVPQFSDEEITNYLQEQLEILPEQAKKAAYMAEGSMSEALRVLNEVKDDDITLFRKWMLNCYEHKFGDLVDLAEDFGKYGRETQKSFLAFALNVFRDVLIINHGETSMLRLSDENRAFLEKFSKVFSLHNLEPILGFINDAHYQISRNANSKLVFLDTSIQIATVIKNK